LLGGKNRNKPCFEALSAKIAAFSQNKTALAETARFFDFSQLCSAFSVIFRGLGRTFSQVLN
jgi:hypothetical protein